MGSKQHLFDRQPSCSLQRIFSARLAVAFALSATCCVAAGCGKGNVPQARVIPIQRSDPLGQVRSVLENYAQGQPMGSEQELFPQFVEEVRAVDPDLANAVEKGLAEIQSSPSQATGLAKKLLERLGTARAP